MALLNINGEYKFFNINSGSDWSLNTLVLSDEDYIILKSTESMADYGCWITEKRIIVRFRDDGLKPQPGRLSGDDVHEIELKPGNPFGCIKQVNCDMAFDDVNIQMRHGEYGILW